MVTLNDVAAQAGVSARAVSHAVNGTGRLAPETRRRILEIVRRLGYRKNHAASALRSGKSRMIGVAMPSPYLPFYATMMTALQTRLYEAGYTPVFGLWGGGNLMKKTFSSLFALKIDGIITWQLPDHPEKLDIPAVYYGHSRKSEAVDTVLTDVEDTVSQAAKFLKKRHFRKVGVVANTNDLRVTLLKKQCASSGIEIRPEWMFHYTTSEAEDRQRIAGSWLKLKGKPELLVFTDDMLCSALSGSLKRHGSLPELLCFRNSYLLPLIGKKMTAFDMHEEAIVSALVEMLLSRLKDPALPARCRKIRTELKTIS